MSDTYETINMEFRLPLGLQASIGADPKELAATQFGWAGQDIDGDPIAFVRQKFAEQLVEKLKAGVDQHLENQKQAVKAGIDSAVAALPDPE